MIIRKKFERLINLESYGGKAKFENIKIGTDLEEEFNPKSEDIIERIKEIKNKGILLGKIAKSINEEEVKMVIEKIKEEASHV